MQRTSTNEARAIYPLLKLDFAFRKLRSFIFVPDLLGSLGTPPRRQESQGRNLSGTTNVLQTLTAKLWEEARFQNIRGLPMCFAFANAPVRLHEGDPP